MIIYAYGNVAIIIAQSAERTLKMFHKILGAVWVYCAFLFVMLAIIAREYATPLWALLPTGSLLFGVWVFTEDFGDKEEVNDATQFEIKKWFKPK